MATIINIVSLQDVKDFIQSDFPDGRFVFADEDAGGHATDERGQTVLQRTCSYVEARLARYYARPFVLTDAVTIDLLKEIVQYITAYRLVEEAYRGADDYPEPIKNWLAEAQGLLKEFTVNGSVLPGEIPIVFNSITTANYGDRAMYEPKAKEGRVIFHDPTYFGDDLLNK